MIKQDIVTEITMLCITTTGRSHANEPVKIKRSLRPARTQLSTLSYILQRLAKAQSTISDPIRFFKPIERETLGRDQVNQLHTSSENGTPNQKLIANTRGGETQTLDPNSTKLNQIRGGCSRHHKHQETKLWHASGPTKANTKKIDTAE